uniref:PfkB domain-containing protein n=1 Tax=Pristionchus pacificus TaxID=54126 RepID=A0A8R1UNM7_PRIPA
MRSSLTRLLTSVRPSSSSSSALSDRLMVSDEIRAAQNDERVAAVVRKGGAVPATIALIDGKIRVGLTSSELESISQDKKAVKVSRRDVAYALSKGLTGGTTVASTMWAAHHAGIRVFSTGGIGGVHRGAEETFDISADLTELSQTPVTVVCAGIKSILDVGKTLEVLETQGVNTLVYGPENVFPGFFSPRTPFAGQTNSESIEELAQIIALSASLGLPAGTILAVPLPAHLAAEGKVVEDAIQLALEKANNKKIRGQAITPFLLSHVAKTTKGISMRTNVALLENNARVAAQLANILAKKEVPSSSNRVHATEKQQQKNAPDKGTKQPKVTVVGASILDFEAITTENLKHDGGSYAGRVVQRCGGVGRNHSEAVGRLITTAAAATGTLSGRDAAGAAKTAAGSGAAADVVLLSAVGADTHGVFLLQQTGKYVDVSRILRSSSTPTAIYMSMNHHGNVLYGISCVEQIIKEISPEYISVNEEAIATADYVISDGNIRVETLSKVLEIAKFHGKKVWFEPTDIAKATKFLDSSSPSSVTAVSPNAREFLSILKRLGVDADPSSIASPSSLLTLLHSLPPSLPHLDLLLVTMAEHGSLLVSREQVAEKFKVSECALGTVHIIPPPRTQIVSVSGAGDTMNSALLSSLLHSRSLEQSIDFSLQAVSHTLGSTDAVAEGLSEMERP